MNDIRFSRQLVIPEIGRNGQRKLKEGKVLVVGAGGLGSPVLAYLAAAGVGTIGICDGDEVELSNLNRQILHSSETIGVSKAENAARFLQALHPDVRSIPLPRRLNEQSLAEDWVKGYDLLIDCSDNFEARFLLNQLALDQGIPLVHAAVIRWMGQATTFLPGGPCYRCLLPHEPKHLPTPAESGVLGTLPGIMGSIQATEAIKLLLGTGDLLAGRMLVFDGLRMAFETVPLRKRKDCPACG